MGFPQHRPPSRLSNVISVEIYWVKAEWGAFLWPETTAWAAR